ncbi:MAG: AEC family transporter [Fusobacteriaceae bacterium]|nr:AEC family transporter [Fusobacteriaceae bacterium]
MENAVVSLNVVMPLFIIMVLGYFLKKYKIYDAESLRIFNNVVFRVFLPLNLFNTIYKTNLSESFDKKLTIFSIGAVIFLFIILLVVVPKLENVNEKRGVIIQGLFRSNFVIMGLPIAMNIYGENNVGTVAILIAFVVPLLNVLAVISLEIFRDKKIDCIKIIKGILKNPLIIGAFFGIVVLKFNIPIPHFLKITVSELGKIATPLAILLLGGSFEFHSVEKYFKQTMYIVFLKLIVIPSIFVALGVMAGFTGIKLLIIYVIFGTPTAVSSFNMAQQMGGDSELAGQIVIFTTMMSIVSIFIGIFIMKSFNLI